MDLIQAIKDCKGPESDPDAEIKKIYELPFARELTENKLKLTEMTFDDLLRALKTGNYLNLDTSCLVDEISWRIGGDQELFGKYYEIEDFTDVKKENFTDVKKEKFTDVKKDEIDPIIGVSECEIKADIFKLKKDIDTILYNELRKKYERGWKEKFSVRFLRFSIENIVACGNMRFLRYVYEEQMYGLSSDLYRFAASYGQTECIQYLLEKNIIADSSYILYAAKNGHLDCIKLLYHDNLSVSIKTETMPEVCATKGYLDCLKYLHERKCEWNSRTLIVAAANGHLECLKYAYENGCGPWDSSVTDLASEGGHLECLRYAHSNGCPMTPYSASHAGNLDCLKYAVENGVPFGAGTLCFMISRNNVECTKYLLEKKCVWNPDVIYKVSYEMLKMLHEHGMPWSVKVSKKAAGTSLECLKYVHENGCPWDENTCAEAASKGLLECLRYAHEKGCPWDQKTIVFGCGQRKIDCVEYALNNGCPFTREILDTFIPLPSSVYELAIKILESGGSE